MGHGFGMQAAGFAPGSMLGVAAGAGTAFQASPRPDRLRRFRTGKRSAETGGSAGVRRRDMLADGIGGKTGDEATHVRKHSSGLVSGRR